MLYNSRCSFRISPKLHYIQSTQNQGVQLKPRIVAAISDTCNWIDGTVEKLKYLDFGDDGGTDVCTYVL